MDSLLNCAQCQTITLSRLAWTPIEQGHCELLYLHLCLCKFNNNVFVETEMDLMAVWWTNRTQEETDVSVLFLLSLDMQLGLCFKQQHCDGKSPRPHRHKHTTDWTNDTLPQKTFSSAAWTRVIGHNCQKFLKGWTTMGTFCEDTDQFTSNFRG